MFYKPDPYFYGRREIQKKRCCGYRSLTIDDPNSDNPDYELLTIIRTEGEPTHSYIKKS
jgi:hypothetical protein